MIHFPLAFAPASIKVALAASLKGSMAFVAD
jgi:hypothetical protein